MNNQTGFRMRQSDADHLYDSAVRYAINRNTYASDAVLDGLTVDASLLSSTEAGRLISFIHSQTGQMRNPARWDHVLSLLSEAHHTGECLLQIESLDRRILFACAFRHDIHSTDPMIPQLWERWLTDYATVLYRNNWNLVSARDLIWENLIPLSEPLGSIQDIAGRLEPDDDRWLPVFRKLRNRVEVR